MRRDYLTAAVVFFLLGMVNPAAGAENTAPRNNYSPYVERDFPENLYWGDTHVHSSRSFDAYTWGLGNRLDPDLAYRFALGEVVETHGGKQARIDRPLDFIVLADHSDFLGVMLRVQRQDPLFLATALGKRWDKLVRQGQYRTIFKDFAAVVGGNTELRVTPEVQRSVWEEVIASADRFNNPGKFTAFIGYEWTSNEMGLNLHRNVIFRDGADKARQVVPFSFMDSIDPEDLWAWMQMYESKTQGRILAIPHNGNLSNGTMFADQTMSGEELTREYAATRARWEPLYEATQVKGDGEAHPYLSPDDGFADFETWDYGSIGSKSIAKEPRMLQHEYARSALKLGLKHESLLSVNPFKFGMVGGTDVHNSFSAISEDNFFGKFAGEEPDSAARVKSKFKRTGTNILPGPIGLAAAGYTGVWARENTRASLFNAMQRKETYATTGPRIILRFFGGWDFAADAAQRPDYVAIGYRQGVPMGGDLTSAPKDAAPDFLIVASKAPEGANLDRIQVVKGWLDKAAELHENVYDVALSDDREVDGKGEAKPLISTVDLEKASYTNSIGAAQLATVWTDPDFDPGQRAFYYVRVLEIPTPRWSTYDSVFFDAPLSTEVPPIIQERAYSSPIWYTP